MKLKALAAATIAASTLVLGSGIAHATAPEPSGWDDAPDQITGSGSDTTYNFVQKLDVLYNQAQGCETVNTYTAGSPTNAAATGKCIVPSNNATNTTGNWDHDFSTQKYPVGSGTGIKQLLDSANSGVDFARSSRGPNATGETGTNFWAYGKDGLAIVTAGSQTPGNITKAQLQGIYNCTITTWDAITGNPADATRTIEPIGMNSASGTYSVFKTYLGADPNAGACVKKLDAVGSQAAIYPFENDWKPVLASTGINKDNAIWWMSFAEYRAFSYKRQTAQTWTVDGKTISAATISNNTYPITRFVYHVTKTADASPDAATDNVLGGDTGKSGAVREYTEFLCKTSANHSANDYSGLSNYDELTAVYAATGFIRVPSAERTNGVCKVVVAP